MIAVLGKCPWPAASRWSAASFEAFGSLGNRRITILFAENGGASVSSAVDRSLACFGNGAAAGRPCGRAGDWCTQHRPTPAVPAIGSGRQTVRRLIGTGSRLLRPSSSHRNRDNFFCNWKNGLAKFVSSFIPTGKEVIFAAIRGGNENDSVHLNAIKRVCCS